jgi:RNA polymerase sigma factor (sigma-70 family)
MSGEAMILRHRGERGCGFPEKANPNRPGLEARATSGTPGDTSSYPAKCNPRARRSPLTEVQRGLAAKYLPLACAMVRRSGFTKLERDELESAAFVALVEAAQSFDPEKNVNFATFARHRIRGALSDFRRSWLRLARNRSAVASPKYRRLSTHDDLEGAALDEMTAPLDRHEIEETEELESYFRRLPKAQASACRLIYLDGKSQDEAAAQLGYSKAYLSRLHRDALESLSRDYTDVPALYQKARGETEN